jgi:hypothetical protein
MAIDREWTDDRGHRLRIENGPPPADAIRLLYFNGEWVDQTPGKWAPSLFRRLGDVIDASEAEAEELSYDDALHIARGCHDYGGGYEGTETAVYQQGISTVIAALEAGAKNGLRDSQVAALHSAGKKEEGK